MCQLAGDSDSTTREPGNTSEAPGDSQFDLRDAELDERDREVLGPAESNLDTDSASGPHTDE
jgi:hypothetical protein